jgi:hypothetical protein
MSKQDSTFRTSHVLDNEIIKANDFEFAFEQIIENVAKATQMLLESSQDFVINGKVIPDSGMNLKVSPIYGVCKLTGLPFGRTETTDETIGFAGSESGRIDILEVKGDWEDYDNQQRAFNDPDTDTQTYQYVDTKKLFTPVYQVKQGVEGANVAPEVDSGWVKLAEVSIRAGATSILASDIHNITADVAGMDNEDWTSQPSITYNIGYISDVNKRFRVQHNEDGTHADDCINSDSLDIGTGTKQINGNILPVGGNITLPGSSVISTESLYSAITKVAAIITTIYNTYLKYGNYGFKGTLSVSSIADSSNNLTKPITITAPGDGTATIKINGSTVLSIAADGKISTNGYTASSANNLVTKAVTDALSASISGLATRVTNVENALTSNYNYINKLLSTDRYNTLTSVDLATTANITLSGAQTIDGVTPSNGDTILVKNQTNKKQNGVYSYSSNSAWTRNSNYTSPNSFLHKLIQVNKGTANKGRIFYEPDTSFVNGSAFGSDNIEFVIFIASVEKDLNSKLIMRDNSGRAKVKSVCTSCEDYIANMNDINNLYGNTVGTALGTAAVGTATTFARSDHVHPMPTVITCSCKTYHIMATGNANRQLLLGEATESVGYGYTYVANSCKVTFNPSTGVLTATCFCGISEYANKIDIAGYGWGQFYCTTATGQPTYIWGTHNTGDTCLYNPANFCVCSACNANCAGVATVANAINVNGSGCGTFNYTEQAGQPTQVWGTNDRCNTYPWNPSCFCVLHSECSTNADFAGVLKGNVATGSGNVFVSGSSLVNNSGVTILYYAADEPGNQVRSLRPNKTVAITPGYTYVYVFIL